LLIPTLPSFTGSFQGDAVDSRKLRSANFIKVLRVPYSIRRCAGIKSANSMRKSDSHRTLTAFSLVLALALALACSVQRVSWEPSPVANAVGVSASHGGAFAISTRVTAAPMLTSGTFEPPTAPALSLAMADFTGDTHPDLATVELEKLDSSSARYWIEIRLTEGRHQILKLTAPFGGLLITPRDVTGDGNLDLIVRSASSRAPVALFLNDGNGHFSRADVASFANALNDGPSQFALMAQEIYLGANLACLESYTAECPAGPLAYVQEQEGAMFLPNYRSASRLFLSFGANRAPPSLA
jgi:hypothetical protein